MPEMTVDMDDVRLDRFLRERLPGLPLSRIFSLIRKGKVRVGGRKASGSDRLSRGQAVIVHIPEENFREAMEVRDAGGRRRGRVLPPFPIEVVYEDSDLIAINKPPGVPVHPGSGYAGGTCIDRIIEHLGHAIGAGGFTPALVHRLDADTSGVLLAAKTERSLRAMGRAFGMRRVTKNYLALVAGVPRESSGRIELAVTRLDGPSREREEREGVTDFQVVGIGKAEGGGAVFEVALLRLNIRTGRTHQIRSHMRSAGTPLIGDPLYGDPAINAAFLKLSGLGRQFLHAHELTFRHPFGGDLVTIRAPLQGDLTGALTVSGLASLIR